MPHEGDGDTKCQYGNWNSLQKFGKEAGRAGNRRTSRDNTNYTIVEIAQNTEKSLRGPEETCCHLDSSENTSTNDEVLLLLLLLL